MFILTTSKTGGVYHVMNDNKKKTVQCFEERDDAVRYLTLLQAEPDFQVGLDVVEVDPDVVALNCSNYGYNYSVVRPEVFETDPTK